MSEPIAESPLTTLASWEEHGAIWRTRSLTETEAVVELFTCHGELVGGLRSDDPDLLRYLAKRFRSDEPD